MCCRAGESSGIALRALSGLVEEEEIRKRRASCAEFDRPVSAGVVVHDNLLYDDSSADCKRKPATALEAAAVEANRAAAADSITLLCEEVSRLFTQYNAAFKCASPGDKHSDQLRLRLYGLLRCVDSTSDSKVLDGDIPALG
ncbi:uncharacterized protein LOC112344313 [Selaginella moellendorffii]|uniref:uncharacterized protein LOC112344313 n=1 Tax=Selaginella moellendorffii TaxID=88036 RepID=UPI000D1C3EE5|nr:uncharacterized protein LOC112344313 [Selaginella moellendorffii]|eukprot:XP_024524537.1 uncharacterized protein LOC112344313 [Selaginella moellendorffii]